MAAALGVALTTLLVYALDDVAPVLSLGVVYLLVVLVVATVWGAWLALATAVVSALAFNFFHIPPTGRFTIADRGELGRAGRVLPRRGRRELAGRARPQARAEADERRQEADLSAEMARLLLRGGRLEETLPSVGARLAQAFGLPSAAIELRAVDAGERSVVFALREGTRQIGTLVLPAGAPEAVLRRVQVRVAPALEALLAAALERDALQAEVVETAALRRSDVIKTALLRSVSHDLRSPLTAILTTAEALHSPSLTPEERAELAAVGDRRGAPPLAADRRPARPLAPGGRRRRAAPGVVLGRRGRPRPRSTTSTSRRRPSRSRSTPTSRPFAPTPPSSSARSRTCSRTPTGTPAATPSPSAARDVGGRILLRFVDRGPGIPQAQRERIFEPFYRSGTEATGHRGSGLGLAIVRGFVEANGGRVWVESLPDQATSFVVELPRSA